MPTPKINSATAVNRYLPLFAAITAVTPLAIDMYLPAMPQIADSLNSNITTLQNSLSLYLFFYALGMFVFGPLADHFGRKKMLVVGLSGYSLFSLLLALTNDITSFLIYRILQAMFGGAATLVIPGTIRLLFGKDTVKGLSYVSSIMMIAPMLAPTIGGALLELSDWRVIFLFLFGYSLLVLVVSLVTFPKFEVAKHTQSGFKKLYLVGYQTIFTSRNTRGLLLVSMLGSFTFFTYVTGIAFVYISLFGVSEMTFGLLFGLNVLGLMAANLVNSKYSSRLGAINIMGKIWYVAIFSAVCLTIAVLIHAKLWIVVISLLPIMGCLMVLIVNADSLILLEFGQQTGTATAVIGTLRFGSGALAGPILTLMYDGSAIPFVVLIFSGVLCIGAIHFGYNRRQQFSDALE
jgi:MFS transporter, DHA1 family, multidrug resistance protein